MATIILPAVSICLYPEIKVQLNLFCSNCVTACNVSNQSPPLCSLTCWHLSVSPPEKLLRNVSAPGPRLVVRCWRRCPKHHIAAISSIITGSILVVAINLAIALLAIDCAPVHIFFVKL